MVNHKWTLYIDVCLLILNQDNVKDLRIYSYTVLFDNTDITWSTYCMNIFFTKCHATSVTYLPTYSTKDVTPFPPPETAFTETLYVV